MALQQQRYDRIISHLAAHEFLSVPEAAHLLGTSPATVRRDFSDLAERKLLEKTRGGARRATAVPDGMSPFLLREVRFSREKDLLMRCAVSFLSPADVVFVDGGTTTFHMAGCLPPFPLRLVTNSLRLAAALDQTSAKTPNLEVFLTGGYLYPQASLLLGPQTVSSFSHYHARWMFLSCEGISPAGLSNTNEMVVEVERMMISRADKVVVVADHSKLGVRSMCHLCGLGEIDILITDAQGTEATVLQECRKEGVEVILVET